MIKGNSVLGVIPARGGSKRVPGKNLRMLNGKSLIALSIDEARRSKYIDRLILTSEDPEIISAARICGCEVPFVRPAELAEDETPGIDPVLHALKEMPGFDLVVLLQPTSPMRLAADIDGCIEKCVDQNANACVTVTIADENPHWMYKLDDHGLMKPLLQTDNAPAGRQDAGAIYSLNGAVYVARCDWLAKQRSFVTPETFAYPMPGERSLDIDTAEDLQFAEFLMQKNSHAA